MSQPWLDDLSEDWIPETTPPSLPKNATNPLTAQTSQSVPPKPQSRLPRMRNSSGSFSEIQLRHATRELRPPKRRSALAERSLSDNNIPPPASADASSIAPSRCASQSFSGASLASVVCDGTVAQKPASNSASKPKAVHDTPEWRRRLLKGDIGYGDQKDLFSPMGLENIFQKPKGTTSAEEKPQRQLGLLKGLSAMPSSPPPWSEAERDEPDLTRHAQERVPVEPKPDTEDAIAQDYDEPLPGDSHIQSGVSFSTTGVAGNHGLPRTVSGQIEFENENFSPVYLSTNLRVGTGPAHIPSFRGSELANRLRHLGSPPPNEETHPIQEDNSGIQGRVDSSFARFQDESLPEDLPAGTPDLAEVGRFVEVRRGGYSSDGSFRRRPLSPSPQRPVIRSTLRNEATSILDSNGDTMTDNAHEANTALSPRTPRRSGKPKDQSPERTKSSGSPLKLFAAHDTFTSNRLQRRLSQLEQKVDKSASNGAQTNKTEMLRSVQKTSQLASVEEVSIHRGGTTAVIESHQSHNRVETFGQGELNEYQFSGDFSVVSSPASEGHSAPDESPSMDVAPPGSRQPLKFHYDASPTSREPSRTKRQGLTRVTNPFRVSSVTKSRITSHKSATQQEVTEMHEYADGKRGPTSPFKNPTPKRRRTQHSVDEEEDDVPDTELHSVKDSHIAMQSVIGRKRKDARQEQSNNIADPEVLARRHILRPRNPTPSQRRLDEMHAEILEATEAFIHSSPKMNTIREHIDPPDDLGAPSEEARAAIVANEVAAFSMKRQQVARDESRKRSVTTQDFLDEAVKIMDYIRAKGRPASGLGSLEETESESPVMQEKNNYPSSSFTFDRPPSREGRLSAWKQPNKQELNPQVISHLRKFQEKESDDILGSSFHSLRFSRMRGPASPEGDSVVVEQDNIRITDNRNRHNPEPRNGDDQIGSQPRTNITQPSTNSSLGQTVATSTSRRSDHVATLAPEAVAHLIPKEIAGMSFDRENNVWVRQKSPSKEIHCPDESIGGVNESEDDPFGNIPDLTVDETVERLINRCSPARPQPTAETFLEETEEGVYDDKTRPVTREGQGISLPDTSSVPSKVSNFAWSFPKTETRATSWSDQDTRRGGTQKIHHAPITHTIPESEEDDVEHEIKYFEGRGTASSAVRNACVRDITISIAERGFANDIEHQHTSGSPRKSSHWRSGTRHQPPSTKSAWGRPGGAMTLPHARTTSKPRFGEEDDLPSRNYRMQLSMSVSAPVLAQPDALVPAPSSPVKADVTFMLSDLPEFTLNQVDECELPDRVVVKHDGHKFSKALEDRYALGTAELVKALQDAEPNEPYWEDLREVNLHDKGLANLHRLDEFCYRLEELDVSNNSISQVKGIPFTMRRLQAQKNCLTGLTSWAALMNLQHLDISNNEIDSLDGLSELVHLRTLKVDDNVIKSLDGILHLDGLMELSAARNEIELVDFAKGNL